MRRNKYLYAKAAEDGPLWVANITKVELDKEFCITRTSEDGTPYKAFFGKGKPVYKFDLRTPSGRTIATDYIRAPTIRSVLRAITVRYPTVQGEIGI